MKLEFLDDISDGGKYKNVISERLVRIFDFTETEVSQFISAIKSTILHRGEDLDLHNLHFVKAVNCKLRMSVANKNYGIVQDMESGLLVCKLTPDGYRNLIERIELTTSGYNWLYDDSIDDIDFLFSEGGTW